jgi:protein-S-isoprenylcysteine O-methyltransferase Ste14
MAKKADILSWVLSAVAGALTVAQFVLLFALELPERVAALRVAGYVLWAASAYLGWAPIFELKKYGGVPKGKSYVHTTKLVTRGTYAVVRHPQFLAGPLLNVGIAAVGQHWLLALLGAVCVPAWYHSMVWADGEALAKFGDDYKDYMAEVPRANFVWGLIKLARRGKGR